MAENIDHRTQARINKIDQEITNHENEIIKLQKLKEALLSSNSHGPLDTKAITTSISNQTESVLLVREKITEGQIVEYAKKTAAKNTRGGFLGKGKISILFLILK